MKNKMKLIKIITMIVVFGFLLLGCSEDEEAYLRIINQYNEPIVMVDIGDTRYANLNINDYKDFTVFFANDESWVNIVYGNSNLRQCFIEFEKGKTSVIILNKEGDLEVYVPYSGDKEKI